MRHWEFCSKSPRLVILFAAAIAASLLHAQNQTPANPPPVATSTTAATLIRRVLDDQVAAWNRGDIPAFMEGYDNSDSTTFVGAAITKGHAQVLARYLKSYPTREKMGALRFSDIEIRMLGTDYASAIGRFDLDRAADAGGEASGIFTLVFHNTGQGWKVILDHTN